MNITKENYEHMKAFSEALQVEIAQFENQKAEPAERAWPMSVADLPEDENFFFIKDGKIEMNDGSWPKDDCDFATETDAKSALAFAQLSRLIRHINGGWEPDFKLSGIKYSIYTDRCEINTAGCEFRPALPRCLYFKNEEDAQRSIETHRQLWLDYFQVDEQ